MVGNTLGHYKVIEKLGSGGMGDVYIAEDLTLGRKVALKVLPSDLANDPDRRDRFVREARAVAALSHPNVLAIHDFGEDRGIAFAVTELLEGQTLRQRLDEGSLSPVEAMEFARQMADGLAAAHARGIVHRDLKPENLFVTSNSKIKILDFGLAKKAEEGGGEETPTQTRATEPGTIMGTVGYMAPEQVRGRSADHRSDVFSFGTVLYEMLSGERAFRGESAAVTLSAILKEQPPELLKTKPDLPSSLERIVTRCLEKNPDERFQSAQDVGDAIDALSEERTTERPPVIDEEPPRRKGKWKFFLAFLVIFTPAVLAIWFLDRTSDVRWAREALPEIVGLVDEGDYFTAFEIARRVEAIMPDDPLLNRLWPQFTFDASIETTPPDAGVYFGRYGAAEVELEYLGQTPIEQIRLPREPLEYRVAKEGFTPVEGAWHRWFPNLSIILDEEQSVPSGMVRAGGQTELFITGLEHLDPGPLGDYWIDKHEVTNEQFKEFVDQGGYQTHEHWIHEFVRNGRVVPWEQAMAEFVDATGRPGPSTWEAGDYPEGEDDFPVAGVSWYEAAAYAEYVGKVLPTIFHWNKAAATWLSGQIVPLSNFGDATAVVGSHRGMSAYGTYDMAGNVREWCLNASTLGERFILGGGWSDAFYTFNDAYTQDPFDRSAINGFRCMTYLDEPDNMASLADPVELPYRDYSTEEPVSNEIFTVYKNLYSYDKTDLNAEIESEDEGQGDWVRQKIVFDAGYGNERMLAYLFLPKNGSPPYQTLVYFPGSDAIHTRSSESLTPGPFGFLLKSGRAIMYPIYKGTYERGDGLDSDYPDETSFYKDHVIMWSKDLGRSIDYLESRQDLKAAELAYIGASWGGLLGPIMMAVEDRFQTGVLLVAGLLFQKAQPEVDPINFLPRVTVPVLMLNGRYDFFFPLETSQQPFFGFLGTPPEHKRMFVYEDGHSVPRTELIKETLSWLDVYLGPVR